MGDYIKEITETYIKSFVVFLEKHGYVIMTNEDYSKITQKILDDFIKEYTERI